MLKRGEQKGCRWFELEVACYFEILLPTTLSASGGISPLFQRYTKLHEEAVLLFSRPEQVASKLGW